MYQLDEDWHGAVVDDDARVLGSSGCHVGQRPRGLEGESGVFETVEELDKPRDDSRSDHLGDRRVSLDREDLTQPDARLELAGEEGRGW